MQRKSISSIANPIVKHMVLLSEKARERRQTGLIIVEGKREIGLALTSGLILETLVYVPDIVDNTSLNILIDRANYDFDLIDVPSAVYEKIAYRESTEGLVAIFKARELTLDQIRFSRPNPLILVAEAPEKPGNIGALLRTCDAAGADAFLIANPTTDIYNPNIIRSSVGGLFTNQVASGTTQEIISFLNHHNVSIYCAVLVDGALPCYDMDFTGPTAIIVGTEATGLSREWIDSGHKNIIIPMAGKLDSMNVSVSAAILLFEAVRQRLLVP